MQNIAWIILGVAGGLIVAYCFWAEKGREEF